MRSGRQWKYRSILIHGKPDDEDDELDESARGGVGAVSYRKVYVRLTVCRDSGEKDRKSERFLNHCCLAGSDSAVHSRAGRVFLPDRIDKAAFHTEMSVTEMPDLPDIMEGRAIFCRKPHYS